MVNLSKNTMQKTAAPFVDGVHLQTGQAVRVHMENGCIAAIEPISQDNERTTLPLPFLAPGLVDLQINGLGGIDFNTPPITTEDMVNATKKLWTEGVTTYYPTVITNSDEAIEEMVYSIAQARHNDPLTSASIAGIHVEGPFISAEDGPRGAHGKAYVKAPDWELFARFQRAADGLIKIITLSPEWAEAPAFIERCVKSGVKVSIGHTAATPEQIQQAVKAGASLSTHLGNGAHPLLPRHPNYIWEQLAQDGLSAGIIADGFHLPLSVIKVFSKVKAKQLFLVSDAVYLSGLEPGKYHTHIGGEVVLTEEGRLHLAENPRLLAGSAQLLPAGIAHLVKNQLCTLDEAWEMASAHPAEIMRLPVSQGMKAGAPADLVTFTWNQDQMRIQINEVYKNGVQVVASKVSNASSQA